MGSNDELDNKNSKGRVTRQASKKRQVNRAETEIRLRCLVAYVLLGIFAVNTLSVLTFIFLDGRGIIHLDIRVTLSLIGETVTHGAGLFYVVTRYLFPTRTR